MITHFESAAEAASALKFDIDDLIDSWFEDHEVYEEIQRHYLGATLRKVGFNFFEEELMSYFESAPDYEVHPDGTISYDDGFGEEIESGEEDWMPLD